MNKRLLVGFDVKLWYYSLMKTSIKKFDEEIEMVRAKTIRPKLLLHACCAPCASSVLETLVDDFDVTVYFYNPNISPKSEFETRLEEIKRYLNLVYPNIKIIAPVWDENDFFTTINGFQEEPEGGARCSKCFELRLTATKNEAKAMDFDYFATTLTVSPLKNAERINAIGEALSTDRCKYLVSDFKKRDGYKKSIELSTKYGLYRQNYCGCIFSKRD